MNSNMIDTMYVDKTKNDGVLYQQKHIHNIKTRLKEGQENYLKQHGRDKISIYEIHAYIQKNTNAYATHPTLSQLLTPAIKIEDEATSINITLVVELCKFFNIDIGYVLALPEDETKLPTPTSYGAKIKQIDDAGYMGSFHCYRLATSHASDTITDSTVKDTLRENTKISHSTLKIESLNGQVVAKMVNTNVTTLKNGQQKTNVIELHGAPLLQTKSNNILLNLTSAEGECYTLFYDYQPFDSGPMYYREAIFLSSTKGTRSLPLLSKMIITRNEIPDNYNPLLRGLLSLNTNTIIISQDKLNELVKTNSCVAQFISDFAKYQDIWKRDFYIIPENIAENNNPNTKMNKIELKKVFLELRSHSYSLAQIIVGDAYKASVIGKEIQNYEYTVNENL